MAHYVLHFPNETDATPRLLERHGLSALVDNCSFGLDKGEGGRQGVMCSWYGVDDMPGPTVQRNWTQLPGKECWMGVEAGRPATPKDLARKQFIPGGQFVVMADGQEWFVPIAAQMPMLWGHDDEGGRIRKPRPEFSGYFEKTQKYYQALVAGIDAAVEAGRDTDIQWPNAFEFCAESLALNYRLTEELACLLGLLDDSAAIRLISTVVCKLDITEFALKKNDHTLTVPVF
jgi:hypothetical protein